MYECIHLGIRHAHVCMYMHIFTYEFMNMHICMYLGRMYICTSIHIAYSMHTYMCKNVYIYVYMYIVRHAWAYVYMYVHKCTDCRYTIMNVHI